MREKGYVGLDVDFEYIQPEDSAAYVGFLQNATARLHAEGYFVNTDLAPKTSSRQRGLLYEAHDYGSIGAVSDTVLLMTYEWGYTYGPPLAVAPLDRVREVVEYAVTQIPVRKILMGIPNILTTGAQPACSTKSGLRTSAASRPNATSWTNSACLAAAIGTRCARLPKTGSI